MASRQTLRKHVTSQRMAPILEGNYTKSAAVLRVADSGIITSTVAWPDVSFLLAMAACALVAIVSVVITTVLFISVRRIRRVQPDKADKDRTPMPKPASAVSVADTDAEYEGIYSRIDDVVPSSRLAHDSNASSDVTTNEPLYATVDEVIKTISHEMAEQEDGINSAASSDGTSRDCPQNGSVQDRVSNTKDALAKALLYTKIDITKTIRYRVKMAQILGMNNKNKLISHKDDDVTTIDYVDNVLYESMISQEENKKSDKDWQSKTRDLNDDVEDCCHVTCENESEEVGFTTNITPNKTANGPNNKKVRWNTFDISPYETIPADFEYENDMLIEEESVFEIINKDADNDTQNNICVKTITGEDGDNKNRHLCIDENDYSMKEMLDSERIDTEKRTTDTQTRETSL